MTQQTDTAELVKALRGQIRRALLGGARLRAIEAAARLEALQAVADAAMVCRAQDLDPEAVDVEVNRRKLYELAVKSSPAANSIDAAPAAEREG